MPLKRIFALLFICLFSLSVYAENVEEITSDTLSIVDEGIHTQNYMQDKKFQLLFDIRMDGQVNYFQEDKTTSMGFKGAYFDLKMNGKIADKFSYDVRYRMNNMHKEPLNFFSALDWAYVDYEINKNWHLSAGKQVVAIGGFEYDLAPIDMYLWSTFWNNVKPFQMGVSAKYISDSKKTTLMAQATNSVCATKTFDSKFAYSLIWYGNYGFYSTISSVNMMEYERGKFINYIVLGNKFTFGNFNLELDWMNRASFEQNGFFKNFSIISTARYQVADKWRLFVKGGYDQNLGQSADTPTETAYDKFVVPGTKYYYYGAGVEFFPLIKKNNNLRFHLFWTSNNNSPIKQEFNIGLRWQIRAVNR